MSICYFENSIVNIFILLYNINWGHYEKKDCVKTTMEWKNDIDENVRSGIVELLVLHLLCERDMYGYEIIKLIALRTNETFIMKQASLYGPLYRMASRGLISSHKEMAGEKRFRMYYHIEDKGREYLEYGKQQINLVFSGVMNLLNWGDAQNGNRE